MHKENLKELLIRAAESERFTIVDAGDNMLLVRSGSVLLRLYVCWASQMGTNVPTMDIAGEYWTDKGWTRYRTFVYEEGLEAAAEKNPSPANPEIAEKYLRRLLKIGRDLFEPE